MAIQINGNGTITGISAGGLPAGTVTSATLARGGGGKVLQVVQTTSNTRFDTTSQTFVDTGFTVTITPTAASSKILINFTGLVNTNGVNHRCYLDIYRSIAGGTATGLAPVGSSGGSGTSSVGFFGSIRCDSSRMQTPTHLHYLDSPSYSLGNAIVYNLYLRSAGSYTVEVPGSNNQEPVIMMATEVAA